MFLVLLAGCAPDEPERAELPKGFVKLRNVDDTILQDMRYFGMRNFVGRPIAGYEARDCVLTKEAAEALSEAQTDFRDLGYAIIVFDCYRPQRAVDDFVAWAANEDQTTKPAYYQNVPKGELFARGYIAEKSGHSRGSTVDLALVKFGDPGKPVDAHLERPCLDDDAYTGPRQYLIFGTAYDCFDVLSHTANESVSLVAQNNRRLLVDTLSAHGFQNYANEWWHFTWQPEPFPETYFDFPIE